MNEENIQTSFLGTGWSFPPEFRKEDKNVIMSSEEKDIKESLIILLSTGLGERIMQPDYGCDLQDLIYEPLTTSLKTYISNLIKNSILYHESRIILNTVLLEPAPDDEGKVFIKVDYTVRTTNTRTNLVYPFYLEEGTNI